MAEEAFSPQMTPPTKIDDDSISFRRNSTEKKASSNSGEKAVPRYLRASTSSCHDFCKFGHRHAVEEKARRPIPRRVTAAKPNESQISVDSVASLGRKKSSPTVAKVKGSPDGPNMTRSLDRMNFVRAERNKTSLAKLKAEASTEKREVSLKKERSSSVKRPSSVNLKSVSAKLMSSADSSGGQNGKGDAKTDKKALTSRVASMKVSPRPSLGGVASLNKKNKSLKKVVSPPCNDVAEAEPAKPENDEVEEKTLYVIKTESEGNSVDIDQIESCSQEIEYVVETENGDNALDWRQSEHCTREVEYVDKIGTEDNGTFELDHSERCVRGKGYVDKIGSEDNGTFELDQSECCVREKEYVDKIGSKDNGTFELDQNERCAREIEYVDKIGTEENGTFELDKSERCAREIEYVNKIEPEKNSTFELDQSKTCDVLVELLPHSSSLSDHPSSPLSLPNEDEEEEEDIEDFEYTMSEYEDDTYSENSEAETTQNSEALDADNKMLKGSGMVHAEDEDEKAWKMKFRRGTVVEIQPEDNAPRRLRFRRGRVLDGQDTGTDGRRRRFKRREGEEDDGAGNGAEKIVLKHQDVQGRKDAQGLFNNVIKETASKLVESRKSKVKALVGAFETVISLQDGKPSSNTTAS